MNVVSSDPAIRIECYQGMMRVVIHRPEKKDALSVAMYSALADAIQHAERDAGIRVLLLHGSRNCRVL